MTRPERVPYHQVHPLRLATDSGAAIASLDLLFEHDLVLGLIIAVVPSVVVAAGLMRSGDDRHPRQRARRVPASLHDPARPSCPAVRLLGCVISCYAAWQRWPFVVGVAWAVVAPCWSYGLLIERFQRREHR
jgi:hypothetical protein